MCDFKDKWPQVDRILSQLKQLNDLEKLNKLDKKDCPCIYSCCHEIPNRECCGQGYCDEIRKEGDKTENE